MSQLNGKNQKIAIETHELLNFVARESNIIMSNLSSVCLIESLKRNFPRTVSHYYQIKMREEEQLTLMGCRNEKDQLIYDPQKIPKKSSR